MKIGINFGNRPGPQPGSDGAVNMHKGYAMNVNAPRSARETVPIGMKGSKTGAVRVVGLTNR
jgi:hypothetical protein